MDSCLPDRVSTMRELAQAYELIKSHQPRLQFGDEQQLSATTNNLAQSLINEALRALHLALCVMNPETSAHYCGAESSARSNMPHLFSPDAAAGYVGGTTNQQRKGKRIRANDETSRVILTEGHHDDGYVWRKYGEKKINGTHFKRNYFRCSYKYDRGCQATKQIQQQGSNDDNVPIFQVTYISEHTCNCTTTANKYIKNDLPQQSDFNANGRMISRMGDVMIKQMGDVMIRQEQEGLLPPLADVSTVFVDSTPWEESFILSDPYTLSPYHAGYNIINTDDGASDFQFGSTDGYINLEHMVLPPKPLKDNTCFDADLDLLLYDSFIDN